MRGYRGLTKKQRLVLIFLALSTLTIIGLLIWNVWSTLQAGPPAPAPTATPQTIISADTYTHTATNGDTLTDADPYI